MFKELYFENWLNNLNIVYCKLVIIFIKKENSSMIYLKNFTLLDEFQEHDIAWYEEVRRIFNNN